MKDDERARLEHMERQRDEWKARAERAEKRLAEGLRCEVMCGYCEAILDVTLMVATPDGRVGGTTRVVSAPPSE